MKIYVASFNRASNGALSKLINKMKAEDLYTDDHGEADWILAVGDRKETFDFVLERYRENIPIIHLWAGEISQGTHDEVYRHSMTLMSKVQLCTNKIAKERVKSLCKSVDKVYTTVVVGNVMLDNMEIDDSLVPNEPYNLVLYNPPTLYNQSIIIKELSQIVDMVKDKHYIWVEPNGDKNSDLVNKYVTDKTLSRDKFLGLLKNCNRFITNSSCAYYEAPFLIEDDKIIVVGKRNKNRESKNSDMTIPNASENIMKVLRSL